MVVNILEGRVALYQMERWVSALPVEQMWGEGIRAESFTDDRFARTLDALWNVGLDRLTAPMVVDWTQRWNLSLQHLHSDGSSVRLSGAYDTEDDAPGPIPCRGYSKDNDRRGVQLVLGLTVQEEGIPVRLSVHDGNTSDPPLFRSHIEYLASHRTVEPGQTFVADCKACDDVTLGGLRFLGLEVITRMPSTFSLHEAIVRQALEERDSWHELLRNRGRTKADEDVVYHGWHGTVPMQLTCESPDGPEHEPKRWEEQWSAVVVHSSSLEVSHRAEYERTLEVERQRWQSVIDNVEKLKYETRADAEVGLDDVFVPSSVAIVGWLLKGQVVEEQEALPRDRPGRPRKDEVREYRTVFRVRLELTVDGAQREAAQKRFGLFVLLSSQRVTPDWRMGSVLGVYREKNVVEEGFHWIKAPGQVAPVFLHTPTRIAALGLVFMIALAAYRLMQRQVRKSLQERQETIAGHHGRPTSRPTLAFIITRFENVRRTGIRTEHGVVEIVHGVTPVHRHLLELLGLSPELYDPRPSASIGSEVPALPPSSPSYELCSK
jgi:transposase